MSLYGYSTENYIMENSSYGYTFDESSILEMRSNEIDFTDFKDAIEAVKYIVNYYIEIIQLEDKILTEVTSRAASCKNSSQLKTLSNDIRHKYPSQTQAAYKSYDSKKGGANGSTWSKLRRVCRKFNIKYSDTTMEEKKKVAAELDKCKNVIIKLGRNWCEITTADGKKNNKYPKLEELGKALDHIKTIDEDSSQSITSNIYELYKLLVQEISYTLDDINAAKYNLRLEKEKSIAYKVINKFIKSK